MLIKDKLYLHGYMLKKYILFCHLKFSNNCFNKIYSISKYFLYTIYDP